MSNPDNLMLCAVVLALCALCFLLGAAAHKLFFCRHDKDLEELGKALRTAQDLNERRHDRGVLRMRQTAKTDLWEQLDTLLKKHQLELFGTVGYIVTKPTDIQGIE